MENNKKEKKGLVRWGRVLIYSLILAGVVLLIFIVPVIRGDITYEKEGPRRVVSEEPESETGEKAVPGTRDKVVYEIGDTVVPEELLDREIIIPGYSDDFWERYRPMHKFNVRSTDYEFVEFVNYLGEDVYFPEIANLPPYYTALVRFKVTRGVNTYNDSVQVFRTNEFTGDYSDGNIYYSGDPGLKAPCYIDPTGKYILGSESEMPEDILIRFLEPVITGVKIIWDEGEYESGSQEIMEELKNVFHSMNAVPSDKKADEFEDSLKYEVEFTRFDDRKMKYIFTEDGYFIRDNEVYFLEEFDAFISFISDFCTDLEKYQQSS